MLPIDDTLAVLRDHITDPALLQRITRDLIKVEKTAKPEPTKRGKSRLVVLVRAASGSVNFAGGAWVVAEPDPEEPDAPKTPLIDRLRRAVGGHNDAPKRRFQIKTWAQAFEGLKPKTIKASEAQFTIKARQPVEVILLDKETVQ